MAPRPGTPYPGRVRVPTSSRQGGLAILSLDPGLAFLGALAIAAQFAILLPLYRDDAEPFVGWSLLAWGLRLVQLLVPSLRAVVGGDPGMWPVLAVVAGSASGLAFLAAGLAYRAPAAPSGRALRAGAALVVVLGVLTAWPPALAHAMWLAATWVEALALAAAGVAFRPRRARDVRGAAVLAACLAATAVVRLAFEAPLPPPLSTALAPVGALVLILTMTAFIAVVLSGARQRVEFLKNFNATLLDGMGVGLALVGPDLRVLHLNRWMAERFGGVLGGRTCLATYLRRTEQCPACPWREGAPAHREFTVDAPGGRRLHLTCSPLTTPDGSRVLLELLSDVTEQEVLRQRVLHSERLATVGEMAARVAHEVRNPLGVMQVHVDLMRRELEARGDPREALRHAEVVKGEIRRVANLIEAYLRLGRLPKPTPARVDLEALLDGMLAALDAELAGHRIGLRRDRDRSLPAVWADAEQLGQVFANLLRNAIDAMPEGGTLTVASAARDGGVLVEVADTGPGVPAEDAERIFDPFHTTKPHGTGLGLALAREIVQEHRGTLTCRSQAAGATFVVTLPADRRAPR